MARPLVGDELWEIVEPLIPKVPRRHRFPGRKRLDDRKVLTGILFVLQTGIPWEYLPQELGCGSGMTCWRRLREWQQAGVWQRLRDLLLAKASEGAILASTVGNASGVRKKTFAQTSITHTDPSREIITCVSAISIRGTRSTSPYRRNPSFWADHDLAFT